MTKYDKTVPLVGNAHEVGTWIKHVQAYRKLHDVSFKAALKDAGATYTKVVKKEKKAKGERKPNPWMEHLKAFRVDNPDWKTRMSYKDVLISCKSTYKPSQSEPETLEPAEMVVV
jgi:hypothetical protein